MTVLRASWLFSACLLVSAAACAAPADGAAIEEAAVAAMRAALVAQSLRAEVEAVGPAPLLPPGPLTWQVRVMDAAPPAPRMAAWVDVTAAGQPLRSVRVALQVHAWRLAWVARADVPAGALLAPSMAVLQELDVAAAPGALREQEWPAGPTRLRHALLAGRPVTAALLEPAPAVARGDWVHLHLQAGAVSIEQRVEALQDGRPGQRVLVRAGDGAVPQPALVSGPGTVEIVEQPK